MDQACSPSSLRRSLIQPYVKVRSVWHKLVKPPPPAMLQGMLGRPWFVGSKIAETPLAAQLRISWWSVTALDTRRRTKVPLQKHVSLKTTRWLFRCCAFCVCVPLQANCDPTNDHSTTHYSLILHPLIHLSIHACVLHDRFIWLWTAQNHPGGISWNFTFQINVSKFL